MGSDTKDTVLNIIASQVKGVSVEQMKLSDSLMALGADSLDAVEIVLELEAVFKLNISEEDFEKLHTVNDIINFIENRSK